MEDWILFMGGAFLALFVGGLIVTGVLLLIIPRKTLGKIYLFFSILWAIVLICALAPPATYSSGWGGLGFLIWFPLLAVMVIFGIGLLALGNKKSDTASDATKENHQ